MVKKRTNEYLLNDLKKQIKEISIKDGVPKDVRKVIEVYDSAIILNLIVQYKGIYETRMALRVRDILPSGGGCRRTMAENTIEALSEGGFLSSLMSLKLGVADEPFGGAKAVMVTDPKNTPRELVDILFEEFGRKMAPFMVVNGTSIDRIAPDMNTDYRDMECFLKGVESVLGGKIPNGQLRALATGKKPNGTPEGGLLGRPESTGYGVAYATKLAADWIGLPLEEATVAVQGFGKVAIFAIERMVDEYGSKIVAVSDSSGGVVNWSGLDIKALEAHKKETGTVVGFPGTTFITSDNLLELKVDILMPCAKEGQITSDNANRIKAKIVSEGSNMGFTKKGKEIMSKNGIIVLDGILANQAGVDASIVEADQNKDGKLRTFDEVIRDLDKRIEDSFMESLKIMKQKGMSLPEASMTLGNRRRIKRKLGKTLEEILAERAGK